MGHAFTVRAGHRHTTTMGKQRMIDNWERMKGQIMSTWDDLDEDEMKKARGNLSQMVNLIHVQTGEDRQLIMRKMSAFL
ncbi:general stress protein CsbD [Rubrivirga litoralis]|uniref:General stress protein CsbD n=2 Tax=Rubrivirga TaxID=1434037 RepID=A0ABU3BSY8_9BACT|nr:general stress protein CsbD [Rubrivirga sp. F394]MDT0632286.1 general stress protein CsbD [Rubrivirga sp. F394]